MIRMTVMQQPGSPELPHETWGPLQVFSGNSEFVIPEMRETKTRRREY